MDQYNGYENLEDIKAKQREWKKRKRMGVSGTSVKHIPLLQERRLVRKQKKKRS